MVAEMRLSGFLESAWLFVAGVGRRWYYWIYALAFDPLDLYERLIGKPLPLLDQLKAAIGIPGFGLILLVALLLLAAMASFHDLRVRSGNFLSASRPLLKLESISGRFPFLVVRTHKAPTLGIINDCILNLGVRSLVSTIRDVRLKLDYINSREDYIGQDLLPRNTNRKEIVNLPEGDVAFFQLASTWISGERPYSKVPDEISDAQYEVYAKHEVEKSLMIETVQDADLARRYLLRDQQTLLFLRITSENSPVTFCLLRVWNQETPKVEVLSQRLRSYGSARQVRRAISH